MPHEAVTSLVEEVKAAMDTEHKADDIETTVNLYNNLKFKSNIPTEVIEFVDRSLIQVRCSLEDVADNMISSLQARGEKTSRITSQVTEMLKKTGATCQVTATTLLPPLVDLTGETEIVLTKVVARNLKEVDYETEEVKGTMTDIIVKIIEDDPSQYQEGIESQEQILKDCGMSLPEIKAYIASNLPPPPTPPEELERRRQMAEELERLQKAEEERERLAKLKETDPEAYEREVNPKAVNKGLEGLKGDSRRGSMIPARSRQGSLVLAGQERRGSLYDKDVTTRASVAMVTDDPEHKKNLKTALAGAFDDDKIRSLLDGLPADASEEEIAKRLAAAGVTGEAAKQMMAAVKGGGPNMENMRERNDNFEMPNIPNVAIPGLRDGGLPNGVNGVTMRENGGRVKRGSIKRQSEILREKKKSRQEEREEERKRKESYFRKVRDPQGEEEEQTGGARGEEEEQTGGARGG